MILTAVVVISGLVRVLAYDDMKTAYFQLREPLVTNLFWKM